MTNRTEHNLTEVVDRAARALYDRTADPEQPSWEHLDMVQKARIKNAYLPVILTVLDASDEVDQADLSMVARAAEDLWEMDESLVEEMRHYNPADRALLRQQLDILKKRVGL